MEQERGLAQLAISNELSSRNPETAGFLAAIVGSVVLVIITAIVAFPIGIGEQSTWKIIRRQGRLTRLIQTNIANLAGVPSIVYGLLGLAVFCQPGWGEVFFARRVDYEPC